MAAPKIIVAGGSGFIGRHLVPKLAERGYDVIVLSRQPQARMGAWREELWDARTLGQWSEVVDGAQAVLNLSGRSINTRHNAAHQKEIMESRVDSTRALGEAIQRAVRKPAAWVQASALGIYGEPADRVCPESAPVADDFIAMVTRRWEEALVESNTPGVRKVALRIGLALERDGGALRTLATLTRWFLGGSAGSGQQYVSWVHMTDLVEMFIWAIENPDIEGAWNVCTPFPVTNAEFMRELRRALHRPWSPPVPVWAVKVGAAMMGTESHLALGGRRCVPQKFIEKGFRFQFPELRSALQNLLT